MTTAVATQQPSNVYEIVNAQEQYFNKSSIDQQIVWAKECQFATQYLQANNYLNKIAWSNQDSLKNAIINVASIGISLNPALKHAYLVPRDGGVHLDVSYMGLMHLAVLSGAVEWGQAKIVYSSDSYTNNGLDKEPSHIYRAFGDRGEAIGAFCTVKLAGGGFMTEEMSAEDIRAIRDRSKAYASGKSCPWRTDELEMWRKTVVKRASKYWPKVGRLNAAISVINEHEGIDFETEQAEQQKDPLHDKFHQLVAEGDSLEFVLLIRSIDENRYNNLYNSGEKGKKTALKDAVRAMEKQGREALNELIELIDLGEKLAFQEAVEEMSKEAKQQFAREISENQLEVIQSWAKEKQSTNEE